MTTTTTLASWYNVTRSASPREDLMNFAGDFEADFDMDEIENDYRTAVAKLLPGSMFLSGEEFIADVDDDEIHEGWSETLAEEIGMIDLEPMFEAHAAVER